jgi:hypothetical protein
MSEFVAFACVVGAFAAGAALGWCNGRRRVPWPWTRPMVELRLAHGARIASPYREAPPRAETPATVPIEATTELLAEMEAAADVCGDQGPLFEVGRRLELHREGHLLMSPEDARTLTVLGVPIEQIEDSDTPRDVATRAAREYLAALGPEEAKLRFPAIFALGREWGVSQPRASASGASALRELGRKAEQADRWFEEMGLAPMGRDIADEIERQGGKPAGPAGPPKPRPLPPIGPRLSPTSDGEWRTK